METALVCCSLLFTAFSSSAFAQHAGHQSAYQGQVNRAVKALSEDQLLGLRQGKGLGFAKAAELNGLPGPKHVLDLGEELGLTADQTRQITDLFIQMKNEAIALGEDLIAREQDLEQFFRSNQPSEHKLHQLVTAAAVVRGQLRATHLKYHLKTPSTLSDHQVEQYFKLGGYNNSGQPGHSSH